MIKLHARLSHRTDAEPFVARIVRNLQNTVDRNREILLTNQTETMVPGFRGYLMVSHTDDSSTSDSPIWPLPAELDHLAEGDVVRISPRSGEIWVMYRRASTFNSMLVTERCNSYCVMCSQPPKVANDDFLRAAYLEAIPLMSPETRELGITGGEPALLGNGLVELLNACKTHLPQTAIHILTNGRLFRDIEFCRALSSIEHPDLMLGIPLYSDISYRHDHVVQADGAFDETIRGLLNLARFQVPIEIRVVLHRDTVDRLPQLARFITRNLPFASHVALMGLEMMGFARANLPALWIDPADYQPQLRAAVEHFDRHGMSVSIYNHQLCVLDHDLWPFARKSISDWKNEYLPECDRCAVRADCGGFFASSSLRRSDHIQAIEAAASI